MIAGSDLKTGMLQAMARNGGLSFLEVHRRGGPRPDTMHGWFRQPIARVSAGSVEKLVKVLGSEPGDPWYEEPRERTLDPETLNLLDEAVGRAVDRLGDRLVDLLDRRLPHTEQSDER